MSKKKIIDTLQEAVPVCFEEIEKALGKDDVDKEFFKTHEEYPLNNMPEWYAALPVGVSRFPFTYLGYDFVIYTNVLVIKEIILLRTYNIVNNSKVLSRNEFEMKLMTELDLCIIKGKHSPDPVFSPKSNIEDYSTIANLGDYYKKELDVLIRNFEENLLIN